MKRVAIWMAVIIVAAAVYWVAVGMPISRQTYYGCNVCRADRITHTFLFIPLPSETREDDFSRYYRKHVDLQHKHTWQACGWHNRSVHGIEIGDGILLASVLRQEAALAIVKSLPDRRTRKAFCEQFLMPARTSSSYPHAWRKTANSCHALTEAYRQNPNRKDWPAVLKKVGFYPKVGP